MTFKDTHIDQISEMISVAVQKGLCFIHIQLIIPDMSIDIPYDNLIEVLLKYSWHFQVLISRRY